MQNFIITINEPIDEIINHQQAVCHVLNTNLPQDVLEQKLEELRQTESLILLQGQQAIELCRQIKADGVVMEIDEKSLYKKQIFPMREALGTKKVLGVSIPPTRHAAMIVGETEPEFMILKADSNEEVEKLAELLKWYNELFLIQIAVEIKNDSIEVRPLQADFLMTSPRNFKILVAKNKSLD